MIRSRIISLASAVAVGATVLVGGATAWAGTAGTTSCTLRADRPNAANDAIVGREGCSNVISVTGYIKEDRDSFPDDTVGSRTFNGGIAWVYGSCGNGVGNYYSQVNSSSGATMQSSRVYTCL